MEVCVAVSTFCCRKFSGWRGNDVESAFSFFDEHEDCMLGRSWRKIDQERELCSTAQGGAGEEKIPSRKGTDTTMRIELTIYLSEMVHVCFLDRIALIAVQSMSRERVGSDSNVLAVVKSTENGHRSRVDATSGLALYVSSPITHSPL